MSPAMIFNIFLLLMGIALSGGYALWRGQKKGQDALGKENAALTRTKALVRLVGFIPVLSIGLTMLIAGYAIGAVLLMILGGVLTIVSLVQMSAAGETFRNANKNWKRPTPAKKTTPPPAFRSDSADHEHITAEGPAVQTQLDQAKTLLEAGLYTKEEYEAKCREIRKG